MNHQIFWWIKPAFGWTPFFVSLFSYPSMCVSLSTSLFLTIFLHHSFFHLDNGNNNRRNVSMNQYVSFDDIICRRSGSIHHWIQKYLLPRFLIPSLSVLVLNTLFRGVNILEIRDTKKNDLHCPMMDHLDHLFHPWAVSSFPFLLFLLLLLYRLFFPLFTLFILLSNFLSSRILKPHRFLWH